VARQKRLAERETLEIEERKKRVEEDEISGFEQYLAVPNGQTNRIGIKAQKRTTLTKAALQSSKNVTVSAAATVRRIPGTTMSETKVVTMNKRKIITGNSKR